MKWSAETDSPTLKSDLVDLQPASRGARLLRPPRLLGTSFASPGAGTGAELALPRREQRRRALVLVLQAAGAPTTLRRFAVPSDSIVTSRANADGGELLHLEKERVGSRPSCRWAENVSHLRKSSFVAAVHPPGRSRQVRFPCRRRWPSRPCLRGIASEEPAASRASREVEAQRLENVTPGSGRGRCPSRRPGGPRTWDRNRRAGPFAVAYALAVHAELRLRASAFEPLRRREVLEAERPPSSARTGPRWSQPAVVDLHGPAVGGRSS